MDRRKAFLLAIAGSVGSIAALTGCEDHEANIVEMARSKLDDVKSSFDEVQGDVEDFDTRNWRDVVGDLKSSMDNLDQAINDFDEWLNDPSEA
jgi:hypothetical protein